MPISRNNTQLVAVTALIVSMLIWSVSGIAIKHALVVLPPLTLIVLRFVPSVLLMLIVGLVRRNHSLFGLQKLEWRDVPLFLIAGFCQPFLWASWARTRQRQAPAESPTKWISSYCLESEMLL